MSRPRDDVPTPRRHGRRRRHSHGSGRESDAHREPRSRERGDDSLLAALDPSLLSSEERAYAEARRIAEEKVQLWGKLWRLAIIAVPLLIFIWPLGLIVLFFGGFDLAKRAYRVLYEPRLRERFVEEEVSKRIQTSVHEERRNLEGEHARSLEKLSASIAHEIRNPITAAKSLVQQMGEDPTGADNVEYAKVALGELERVERSISHLLRFAREEEMRSVELCMSDILDSALETFRDRAQRERIEIVRSFDCQGRMYGDAEKLRRIAINLLGNAMDSVFGEEGPQRRIEVSMGENLAGSEVWVRIADNGPGISAAEREKIFNPFFTSKEHGTGLGLPITKKLVEAHGGSIEVSNRAEGGAEFLLTFPKEAVSRGRGPGGEA